MSGRSSRKCISKWDLKEESQNSHENMRDGGRTSKSFHDKESRPGWFSPKVGGYNSGHKWSSWETDHMLISKRDLRFQTREPLPGSRGSCKDDYIDDCRENFKASAAWDGDGSYSMKMSPGLDDWRQQISPHSPKTNCNRLCRSRSRSHSRSRSRSTSRSWNRSRSPVRGFRQELEVYDRNRGRSEVSAQLCKDFASGRCRRGNNCQFSHGISQSYEEIRENRHGNTGARKYSTPHESREYSMRSGRIRDTSLDRGGEHEHRKNGDIPCKFFAAGHCRNGKHCRFYHSSQAIASANRRSRDDGLVKGHNLDGMEKRRNGSKWNDTNTFSHVVNLSDKRNGRIGANRRSRDDRWARSRNSDEAEKLWDGPKWSDTDASADAAKFNEDQNDGIGAPKPRISAWSKDERWHHGLDENAARADQTAVRHGAVESDKMDALHCTMKGAGVRMGVSESGGTDNWFGDMEMSPEWNYGVEPSNCATREEHGHITRSSQSLAVNNTSLLGHDHERTRESSVLLHDATATIQPMIIEKSYFKQDHNQREGSGVGLPSTDMNTFGRTATTHIDLNYSANILPTQSFDQNGQISNALPFSSLDSFGQSHSAMTSEHSREGNMKNPHALFQGEKPINKSVVGDTGAQQFTSGIKPTQDMVGAEQSTQLNKLSVSLVQFLGNRQQLPQLYAALNTHNVMQVPLSANTEGSIKPDSAPTSQPNEAIRAQRQYDPLSDSIEHKKQNVVNLSGFLINTGEKSTADVQLDVPCNKVSQLSHVNEPNGLSAEPNGRSQQVKKPEQDADSKFMKNNEVESEDTKKAQVENEIAQENGTIQKMDGDGKDDEGKKSKDVKGLRAFKFALVESVKEILKPSWKEGHIGKDAYKIIVKKVVDKVTGTMQVTANIPQTQEKIDQYLSFSKPKLSKLVQAYVEKFQKG